MGFCNDMIKDAFTEQLYDLFCKDTLEEHVFSASYKEKKEEIINNVNKKQKIHIIPLIELKDNKYFKIIILFLILLIMVPTGVYAANKISGLYAQKNEKITSITIVPENGNINSNAVCMNLGYIPSGLIEIEKNQKYRYDNGCDEGLVLFFYKIDSEDSLEIDYSVECNEFEINGNRGYYIKTERLYNDVFWFVPEYNIAVRMLVTDGIDLEDVKKILSNVSFIKCDDSEVNYDKWSNLVYGNMESDKIYSNSLLEKEINDSSIKKIGQEVKIPFDNKHFVSLVITDVDKYDNINVLDKSKLNIELYKDYINLDGTLKDDKRLFFLNQEDLNCYRPASITMVKQQLIVVKATLTRSSKSITNIACNFPLMYLYKNGNEYMYDTEYLSLCTSESPLKLDNIPMYCSVSSSEDYIKQINFEKRDSIDIEFAYVVDADKLDEIYIDFMNDISHFSIDEDGYITDKKVLENLVDINSK